MSICKHMHLPEYRLTCNPNGLKPFFGWVLTIPADEEQLCLTQFPSCFTEGVDFNGWGAKMTFWAIRFVKALAVLCVILRTSAKKFVLTFSFDVNKRIFCLKYWPTGRCQIPRKHINVIFISLNKSIVRVILEWTDLF